MNRGKNGARHFIPSRTGDATPLGSLELAVMEAVWSGDRPVSVSDVHSALPDAGRGAYTTVKTTLERLVAKGILSQIKDGRAYLYQALVSRDELERRIVSNALDRLVDEFPQAVASFFVHPDNSLTEERLALLRAALERRQEREDA